MKDVRDPIRATLQVRRLVGQVEGFPPSERFRPTTCGTWCGSPPDTRVGYSR